MEHYAAADSLGLPLQLVVAFARAAGTDLEQYDMWRMAYIHWPSVPWRRSALAFLPGLLAKVSQAWEHISVLEALERYNIPVPSLKTARGS